MNDRDRQPEGIGTGRNEPATRRGCARASNRDRFFMIIAVGAGAMGLAYFAGHVSRDQQVVEPDHHSNTQTTVHRFAAVRIWLPQALVEAAQRRATEPPLQTHDELKRVLDGEQLRDVWYALTVREHHDNGRFNDLTVIRRPYDDPRLLPELPAVLAVLVGNPPDDPALDFSLASICVVHDDLGLRTPHEVLGEALGSSRR